MPLLCALKRGPSNMANECKSNNFQASEQICGQWPGRPIIRARAQLSQLSQPPTHTRVAPVLLASTRDGEPKDEEDEVVVVKMFCP